MTQVMSNGVENTSKVDGYSGDKTRRKIPISMKFGKYFAALRPWSFTASFTPVALGSTLAYKYSEEFSFPVFIVTCLTALSVHAAGNLVNTYFDFMKGIDSKKSSDDRTLVDNVLAPGIVSKLGAIFYIAGCLGYLILTFISKAKMEHLALLYFGGLSSSFLYTGGLGLKYIALGDLIIFLTFGPLTVIFSFLSQTGQLTAVPILYALPIALNTEAILHANNSRDMDSDHAAGIVTVAIMLGKTGSYLYFTFLMFIPFIMLVLMGLHISKWMFLPVLCVFEAFNEERHFRQDNLKGMPQRLAKLNLFMGILYIVGCLMASKEGFHLK